LNRAYHTKFEAKPIPRALSEEPVQREVSWDDQAPWPRRHRALADQGYQILEEIGKGCFGTVYKACQSESNRLAALKAIKRNGNGFRGEATLRLSQEVEILSRIEHPSIAEVWAVEEWDRETCIVTEYIDGIDIDAYRGRNNRLDPYRAISLLIEICKGLGHLHGSGIVHRNLKPSNMMINKSEEEPDIKILDFGLPRLVNFSDLKEPSAFRAAVPYISPEQTGILQWPVDHRSDLYSLGVIFFELLTGRRPFDDADPCRVLHQHVAKVPPR